MSKTKNNPSHLENVSFRSHVRANDNGRTFVGYVDLTIVAPSALPDGSDLMLTITDVELAINSELKPVISFKSKKVVREGRDDAYFPYAYSRNAATRAWLTAALFALPEVQRAIKDADPLLALVG